ncbi:hypothetical protein MHYMCMPSP_01024 [Hyalomma marginatum]|uniref:Uncharacterized protein n=1 Tax=Hyalomma marginatum TaxID=34627 RepID=A0A8S4C1B6_9ACAR|nr:hypothetical protein MHYMCMPSP_01024 [Hyalomma marginatum]CAG7598218.1 hypothetical protein MHYMCMPASI_00999 [Hyalomma marginatum]
MHAVDANCTIAEPEFHELAMKFATFIGFDLSNGRIDKSLHQVC